MNSTNQIQQPSVKEVDHVLNNVQNTALMCKAFFDDSPLNFFAFGRIFDDGKMIDLSTSAEWSSFFYEKGLHKTATAKRLIPGVNYLKKSKDKNVLYTEYISAEEFDIANKLDFIRKGENYYDMFIFGASKKNIEKSTKFYTYHQDKILRFIASFTKEAQELIAESYQHKIALPNYEIPEEKVKRVFHKEMSENGYDLGLSAQEFLVLILYAGGSSAQQIADMLYKSVKTIETYIARIKEKTGYKDRRSFNMLVYERGWSRLIGFFLPYMETDSVH